MRVRLIAIIDRNVADEAREMQGALEVQKQRPILLKE